MDNAYRVWRKNALMCYWYWNDDRQLYFFDDSKQRQRTTIGELRREFIEDIRANHPAYYDRLTKDAAYLQRASMPDYYDED